MPITLFVHQDCKEFTEKLIIKGNPTFEHGGFFLGKNHELIIPRFFPNTHNQRTSHYLLPSNWTHFLDYDKEIFGLNEAYFFHNHPSHSVSSSKDLEHIFTDIAILLQYDEEKKTFSWKAYGKDYIEHYIQFVDKKYPIFQKYFAQSLNLINLGSCFITENNELLTNNSLAKSFIEVDKEALIVYKIFQNKAPYHSPTKKKLMELSGLSLTKLNQAMAKLIKNKLINY